MGKVYAPPVTVGEPPDIVKYFGSKGEGVKAYNKAEGEYVGKIVEYATKNGKGSHRGMTVGFGVADGTTLYVILSTSPLALIHVPIGDVYQQPYVHRLTATDIKARASKFNQADYEF